MGFLSSLSKVTWRLGEENWWQHLNLDLSSQNCWLGTYQFSKITNIKGKGEIKRQHNSLSLSLGTPAQNRQVIENPQLLSSGKRKIPISHTVYTWSSTNHQETAKILNLCYESSQQSSDIKHSMRKIRYSGSNKNTSLTIGPLAKKETRMSLLLAEWTEMSN